MLSKIASVSEMLAIVTSMVLCIRDAHGYLIAEDHRHGRRQPHWGQGKASQIGRGTSDLPQPDASQWTIGQRKDDQHQNDADDGRELLESRSGFGEASERRKNE